MNKSAIFLLGKENEYGLSLVSETKDSFLMLYGLYCESKLLGIIYIQAAIKENARKMVETLKSLNIRIAMGGIGSDIAIESADAVIVHDNLDAVPYLWHFECSLGRPFSQLRFCTCSYQRIPAALL